MPLENPDNGHGSRASFRLQVGACLLYAIAVLTIDTLALRGQTFVIDWSFFRWYLGQTGFDAFKFFAWLVIPLALTLYGLDWGYFGVRRWRKIDMAILAAIVVVGALVMLAIPYFPELRRIYRGIPLSRVSKSLIWTFSWLLGWEFLMRYFLLTKLDKAWPRWGWLAIPLLEGAYHLQKPWIEAVGMVLFSLMLTPWALKRRNTLLPLLAHLIIELELIIFMAVIYYAR